MIVNLASNPNAMFKIAMERVMIIGFLYLIRWSFIISFEAAKEEILSCVKGGSVVFGNAL